MNRALMPSQYTMLEEAAEFANKHVSALMYDLP